MSPNDDRYHNMADLQVVRPWSPPAEHNKGRTDLDDSLTAGSIEPDRTPPDLEARRGDVAEWNHPEGSPKLAPAWVGRGYFLPAGTTTLVVGRQARRTSLKLHATGAVTIGPDRHLAQGGALVPTTAQGVLCLASSGEVWAYAEADQTIYYVETLA